MAAQQVQEYLERHRIGTLFEVRILYFHAICLRPKLFTENLYAELNQ